MDNKQRETGFDIIRLICAIFFPPLGVLLQVGLGIHFWINILLTLLGFIPGMIHALYVIFTYDSSELGL